MNIKNYHSNMKWLLQIAAIVSFAIITFSQQAFSQSIVQGTSVGTVVSLFQGAPSQTAALSQWNINGGTAVAAISAAGVGSFAGLTLTAPLPVGSGGTGLSGTPANGQTIIGNGSGFVLANITPGTGISVTNGAGSITVANTGVLSVTGTAPIVSSGGQNPAISLGALGQTSTTVYSTAALTLASAGSGNIPGLTQTFTVPAGYVAYISADVGVQNANGGVTLANQSVDDVYLKVDNAFTADGAYERNSIINSGFAGVASYSFEVSPPLTTGSHTVTVGGFVAGVGGTVTSVTFGGDTNSALEGELTVTLVKL